MKKTKQAEIVMQEVEKAYEFPSYIKDDVRIAMVRALGIIKGRVINEIKALIAFVVLVAGITGLVLTVGAAANKLINLYQFFGLLIFISTTLYIDARWIDKHFDGSEWN